MVHGTNAEEQSNPACDRAIIGPDWPPEIQKGNEMNISSVSSTTYATGQSSTDTASLERQLRSLERELQEVKQGNSDAKTKAQKIKDLETQIQQIKAQIQQQQAQAAKSGTSNKGSSATSETSLVNPAQQRISDSSFDQLA